jgi:hypothetical protein
LRASAHRAVHDRDERGAAGVSAAAIKRPDDESAAT